MSESIALKPLAPLAIALLILAGCDDPLPTAPGTPARAQFDVVTEPYPAGPAPICPFDLGTLGGPNSFAFGVNDAGQVVGYSEVPSGPPPSGAAAPARRAFLWDAATGMTDLGTLPGGWSSEARAINNSGQVVGFSTEPGFYSHAFRWDASTGMQDLPSSPFLGAAAVGINDAGTVVGAIGPMNLSWTSRPARWDQGGGLTSLGGFANAVPGAPFVAFHYGAALSINSQGQIVGTTAWDGPNPAFYPVMFHITSPFRAAVWQPGAAATALAQTNINSGAHGINNTGRVVGFVEVTGCPQDINVMKCTTAYVWQPGAGFNIGLGTLGGYTSVAYGVNDAGEVVGSSRTASDIVHAFFWRDGSAMVDLGTLPGGSVSEARAINARGDVAGTSTTAGGSSHATLWALRLPIQIDIDPKSDGGPLSVTKGGPKFIRVAILTTNYFDASLVDLSTITLGDRARIDTPARKLGPQGFFALEQDVDGDGDVDLVVSFDRTALIANGDLTPATTMLFLLGRLTDGQSVCGANAVQVGP